MAPVESAGILSREGDVEGGANIQRVWRVLISQVSTDGRLSGVRGVPVAADSMPRQCRRGWGKLTGSSLGVWVIKHIAPYLSLHRRFEGKTDDNRPTRRDGVGRNIGASCCPENVHSSGFAPCRASEELVRVVVGHIGRSFGRRPHASLRGAVHMSFVRTDPKGCSAHSQYWLPLIDAYSSNTADSHQSRWSPLLDHPSGRGEVRYSDPSAQPLHLHN